MKNKYEVYKELMEYFPKSIADILSMLPTRAVFAASEIRLRSGRPLSVTTDGQTAFVSVDGSLCHLMQQGLYIVTPEDVQFTFRNMCDSSVYAYANQIKNGYITLKNGCRAGLAATAVYENGEISTLRSISSINIRIATEYKGCAMPIVNCLDGGLLIAGPPSSGKTTLLRDAVRLVSNGSLTERRRVAVVDTRGEIAAVVGGVPQNDLGPLCDVITGVEKAVGIEMAIRTLSPEVIAFDEIFSSSEAAEVKRAFYAGADIFTTVHLNDLNDILNRTAAFEILSSGAIKHVCFIDSVGAVPKVLEVEIMNGKPILKSVESVIKVG